MQATRPASLQKLVHALQKKKVDTKTVCDKYAKTTTLPSPPFTEAHTASTFAFPVHGTQLIFHPTRCTIVSCGALRPGFVTTCTNADEGQHLAKWTLLWNANTNHFPTLRFFGAMG